MREDLGILYPNYTNGEKELIVCRPSRVDGIHDGFDPKIQSVKTADVWGCEKKWAGLYQACGVHGDFKTTVGAVTLNVYSIFQMRMEELCEEMVARSQQR